MTIRRCATALGAVAVGLLALSACSKPTPLATVTVGETSVGSQADCYNAGKALPEETFGKCLKSAPSHTVKVPAGGAVHVGVEPAIADKGWVVAVDSQGVSGKLTTTYHTFSSDVVNQMFSDSQTGAQKSKVTMTILETSGGQSVNGEWNFTLERQN